MKPVLLALSFLSEEHRAQMAQAFEVLYAPDAAQAAAAIAQHGSRVRVVLTINGALVLVLGLLPGGLMALCADAIVRALAT